jgi:hypothetical protein
MSDTTNPGAAVVPDFHQSQTSPWGGLTVAPNDSLQHFEFEYWGHDQVQVFAPWAAVYSGQSVEDHPAVQELFVIMHSCSDFSDIPGSYGRLKTILNGSFGASHPGAPLRIKVQANQTTAWTNMTDPLKYHFDPYYYFTFGRSPGTGSWDYDLSAAGPIPCSLVASQNAQFSYRGGACSADTTGFMCMDDAGAGCHPVGNNGNACVIDTSTFQNCRPFTP